MSWTNRALTTLCLVSLVLFAGACQKAPEGPEFPGIEVYDPPNDKGEALTVVFAVSEERAAGFTSFRVDRAEAAEGPFLPVGTMPGGETEYSFVNDTGNLDGGPVVRGTPYWFRVMGTTMDGEETSPVFGPVKAHAEWFDVTKLATFLALAVFAGLVWYFVRRAKQDPDIYCRPIAGLAAMTEAIGRATEMGKPILFVPGIADMDDIQTITALVILREVAKQAAEFDTPVIVPCRSPVVMTAAEEAARTGCMEAGRPEIYTPDNVRFLSDEQFAFTAATNGIMLREHPATTIYMGAFWAESLILAETGFLAGAIQIAGTANVAQLPFFVAACDYTLIGEELYAASAYLSRDPMLLGSLKGSDWAKMLFATVILIGVVLATRVSPVASPLLAQTLTAAPGSFEEVFAADAEREFTISSDLEEPVAAKIHITAKSGDIFIRQVSLEAFKGTGDGFELIPEGSLSGGLETEPSEKDVVRLEKADGEVYIVVPEDKTLVTPSYLLKPGRSFRLSALARGRDPGASLEVRVVPDKLPLSDDYIEFFK